MVHAVLTGVARQFVTEPKLQDKKYGLTGLGNETTVHSGTVVKCSSFHLMLE